MWRTLFARRRILATLLLPRAALADDAVPLTDTLVAAKLPDGYTAKTADIPGESIRILQTTISKPTPGPRVAVETFLVGKSPTAHDRRQFVRGILNSFTASDSALAKLGFHVINKVVPDLDTETFSGRRW